MGDEVFIHSRNAFGIGGTIEMIVATMSKLQRCPVTNGTLERSDNGDSTDDLVFVDLSHNDEMHHSKVGFVRKPWLKIQYVLLSGFEMVCASLSLRSHRVLANSPGATSCAVGTFSTIPLRLTF